MKKTVFLFYIFLLFCSNAQAVEFSGAKLTGVIDHQTKFNVIPLGDSITFGLFSTDEFGYRKTLQQLLPSNYLFVGTFNDPVSDTTYSTAHDGISSNLATQMLARLPTILSKWCPKPKEKKSIFFIHAGTNEIFNHVDPNTITSTVISIIDTIDTWDPSIDVYVALIIGRERNAGLDADTTTFNGILKTALLSRQATKTNLYIVDMNSAFKDSSLCNPNQGACLEDISTTGNHPNDAGYIVMGQMWYRCFNNSSAQYCNNH